MCYPALALTSAASVSTQGVAAPTDSAANIASATSFSTQSVAAAWLDTPPGLPSPPGLDAIVSTQGVAPALSLPVVFSMETEVKTRMGHKVANNFLKDFRTELHSLDGVEIDLTDGLRFDWKSYVNGHSDRTRMARATRSSHPPPQPPSPNTFTSTPYPIHYQVCAPDCPPACTSLPARPHACSTSTCMFDLLAGPPVRPPELLPPVPFLFPFLLCTPRQDYRLRHHAFHGASARFHRPIRPQEKGGFHRAPLRWLCDSPSPSQIKVEVVSTIRSYARARAVSGLAHWSPSAEDLSHTEQGRGTSCCRRSNPTVRQAFTP